MHERVAEIIEALDREITRPVTDWARIGELAAEMSRIATENTEET
jgi:hypothetical protein